LQELRYFISPICAGIISLISIFEYNNLENIKEKKELFEKNKIMDREKL
jgi:hypothetical protein